MALVTYECCFCGEHIDENSKLDPCFVTLDSNFEDEENQQLEQGFFAHYICFKNSLHPGVAMHLNFEDQKKPIRKMYMTSSTSR